MATPIRPGAPVARETPMDNNHPGEYVGDDCVEWARNQVAQWRWVARHLADTGDAIPENREKYARDAAHLEKLLAMVGGA